MKPEAAEHLDRAGEYLTKARSLLDVLHYKDEAGRAAYVAALHAVQALIFQPLDESFGGVGLARAGSADDGDAFVERIEGQSGG